jgi:sugar/nucleoside kinase (ribokinase family)
MNKKVDQQLADNIKALTVVITNGKFFEHAIVFASSTAAISVVREDAQPYLSNRLEIESFLK